MTSNDNLGATSHSEYNSSIRLNQFANEEAVDSIITAGDDVPLRRKLEESKFNQHHEYDNGT